MTVETTEKLYTVEEFLALELPEDENEDNYEYQLIGGWIVRQGTTSGKHGDIVTRVATALNLFGGVAAGEQRIGTVYSGSSTDLGNPKGQNYPKPDVCFVLKGNGPVDFEGAIPVAPDLVIEVNSPSDTDARRFEKLQAYQQSEVKLIWSIHMLERFVVVYTKGDSDPAFFSVKGELDGGAVLPGFKLAVKALFE